MISNKVLADLQCSVAVTNMGLVAPTVTRYTRALDRLRVKVPNCLDEPWLSGSDQAAMSRLTAIVRAVFTAYIGSPWSSVLTTATAIRHYHANLGYLVPPLTAASSPLRSFFNGLRKVCTTSWRTRNYLPVIWLGELVEYWLASSCWASQRNAAMAVLQYSTAERGDQLYNAEFLHFTDFGVGQGMAFRIEGMKNRPKGTAKPWFSPVPEYMGGGIPGVSIPVAVTLRAFLLIAPKDGFVFRSTRGQAWEPAIRTSKRGAAKWAQLSSDEWNKSLRKGLQAIFPGIQLPHYSSHSLRIGAATELSRGSVALDDIRLHLSHTRSATTINYIQPDFKTKLARAARIGCVDATSDGSWDDTPPSEGDLEP